MKESTPRFTAPLNVPRPRGARLLEGFSPKLARLVRLFDHFSFEQWIALEADPTVLAFCERPATPAIQAFSDLVTRRATARAPHCGMWPHAAAATSNRARRSARI